MKKLSVLFILPFFFFMGCNLGEGEEVSTIDVETEIAANSLSVLSIQPLDGEGGVELDKNITVVFDNTIDSSTATTDVCSLKKDDNTSVAVNIIVNNDAIVLNPSSSLEENTTYSVNITKNLLDINGDSLVNAFSSSFTTTSSSPIKVSNLHNMTTLAGIPTSSFGTSISISGNGQFIAVGAPTYTAFELNDGLVVTYHKDIDSSWRLNDEIPYYPVVGLPAAGGGENFGLSVSLNFDASYTFFSAPGYLDTATTYDNAGMVALSGLTTSGYNGAPSLIKAVTATPNAFFGKKVVSSEGFIAGSLVYAIAEPGYTNSGIRGRINIYAYDIATFMYMNTPIDLSDMYSYNLDSLAIAGDYGTLIGVQDTYMAPARIQLYKKDPTYGWISSDSLLSNPTADIGHVISISDDATMIATGTNGSDDSIFIFEWNGTSWNQTHALRPTDLPAGSYFGLDLALSGDKNTLLIGAPYADGMAGRVYHYTRDSINNTWSIKHVFTEPIPTANNYFGSKVAIDNNGTTFVIANKAAIGVDSQVYVYEE